MDNLTLQTEEDHSLGGWRVLTAGMSDASEGSQSAEHKYNTAHTEVGSGKVLDE